LIGCASSRRRKAPPASLIISTDRRAATRRSVRDAYDGDLEEVAASAAAATRNRPGAPSGAPARAEQHAQRDGDARRATRQRGGDDSAAAAEAAAEERAGERRSNRQRAGLAAAPRDSDPCELASKLETQDASQHSADGSTPLNSGEPDRTAEFFFRGNLTYGTARRPTRRPLQGTKSIGP